MHPLDLVSKRLSCLQVLKCSQVYNLAFEKDVVAVLLASVNMYRLIPGLLRLAAPMHMRAPLFKAIERDNQTVIIFQPKAVLKVQLHSTKESTS